MLHEVAERVKESTPEERDKIRKRVVAIYYVLRGAAEQESRNANVPMPMLEPGIPEGSVADRTDRMRNAITAFRHTFRRYKRHLNKANREEVMEHAKELARIIAEIDQRTRARRPR